MKKCNTQIMKEIKKLEEYKSNWIANEKINCIVSYTVNEEPILPKYDYSVTSENIKWFDDEIRRLKGLLALSNATVIVKEFDMTINEALIYLAQLKQKEIRLEFLISKKKIERKSNCFGEKMIEYTKVLYDHDVIIKEHMELKDWTN